MNSAFSSLDWAIFIAYFVVLAISSSRLSQIKISSTRAYFIGNNKMPFIAVAISLLATSQSAATFLGGPEYSYSKDLTFLGFYFSAFLAILFVAYVLIPKFYEIKALTVYELLEKRYGALAKQYAGIMFLFGRLFASGARLYIGALAISMILFLDIAPLHIAISIFILIVGALAYSYFGGVESIISSDIIQAVTYIGAGIAVLFYLFFSLDLSFMQTLTLLEENNKLKLIDFSFDGGFSIFALLTGWLLLNISAFGLDQDMTQRALSCKNSKEAQKSLLMSIYLTVPVVMLFLAIGLLLYIFYNQTSISQEFEGEKITIFMYYILNEMPDGLRGLVTVGAIAAALSSTNSVLGAMASVAIEDIYKPFRKKELSEKEFIGASRKAVLIFAFLLSFMAMLSYYWQHYTNLPLLQFALGVMAFSYTGLLGVYGAVLFTNRGTQNTVLFALIGGFITVLALQPYILGLNIGFAYQMVIGTVVSFSIMMVDKK